MSAIERRLREELDEAREEIRQLREILLPRVRVPDEWKLTAKETLFFRALLGRDEVTYAAMAHAMGVDDEPVTHDVLKVILHRVRRKTEPIGVHIETIWGVGLRLADRRAWRARLTGLLNEPHASASGYPGRDTPKPFIGYTRDIA